MSSAEGTGQSSGFTNTLKYLETLVDEALQIYELDNEKTNIIDELYHSLKIITDFLGFSVDLPSGILNMSPDRRIILTATLDVLVIQPNGKSEQKRLEEYSFEEILQILEYAVPTMLNMIRTERTNISEKIAFLRSASKKLVQLHSINNHAKESNHSITIEGVRS